MTTLEVVDTIGSWKLGGTYEDESAANTQLRILNLANIARQTVLRDYYLKMRAIPQVCYQEFDIDVAWEDEECVSFTAKVPKVMSFPEPQVNGWDAIVPICDCAFGLTEVRSEQQLRAFRQHTLMSKMRTAGWYFVTGDYLKGFLKPQVKATGLTGRAVLASPHLLPAFNMDVDQYPFPDDMFSDMKNLLERDNARRWQGENSQISNGKTEIENANRKP
jgi:hypothetical protein